MGGERRLGDGPTDAGDTSWLMFPKDGEMFYFGQHTTWTFPLFVQMTHRLWTLIHLLLSNTMPQLEALAIVLFHVPNHDMERQISRVLIMTPVTLPNLRWFEYEVHKCSSDERREIDLINWHKLFGSFSNAKTLRIDDGLVEELSRFCNRMMESSR